MGSYVYVLCKDGHACCYKGTPNTCLKAQLAIIHRPDNGGYLNEASEAINSILDGVREQNQDTECELALLSFPSTNSDDHNILLLAWVKEGVTAESSVDDIERILPTA